MAPTDWYGIEASMKKELFAELAESVREGGALLRGKRSPSRSFSFDETSAIARGSAYFPNCVAGF